VVLLRHGPTPVGSHVAQKSAGTMGIGMPHAAAFAATGNG
jgi:hypothetical protein